MVLLQQSVSGIRKLQHVKDQNEHDVQHGLPELSFKKYVTLLLSAATNYDEHLTKVKLRPKCQVQYHKASDDIFDPTFDIDTDPSVFMDNDPSESYIVNNRSFRPASNGTGLGPRMSKDQWKQLLPHEKPLWDQFCNNSKGAILGRSTMFQCNHQDQQQQPNFKQPSSSRRVHLHDLMTSDLQGISAADFLQVCMMQLHPESTSEMDEDATTQAVLLADLEPEIAELQVNKHAVTVQQNLMRSGCPLRF